MHCFGRQAGSCLDHIASSQQTADARAPHHGYVADPGRRQQADVGRTQRPAGGSQPAPARCMTARALDERSWHHRFYEGAGPVAIVSNLLQGGDRISAPRQSVTCMHARGSA